MSHLPSKRHWRGYRARCFYHDSYASLFRERERKKYCTECQREYATRKCDTCLDKFCEGCWTRMHSKVCRDIFPQDCSLSQCPSLDFLPSQITAVAVGRITWSKKIRYQGDIDRRHGTTKSTMLKEKNSKLGNCTRCCFNLVILSCGIYDLRASCEATKKKAQKNTL